jgi:streptogramin lyase
MHSYRFVALSILSAVIVAGCAAHSASSGSENSAPNSVLPQMVQLGDGSPWALISLPQGAVFGTMTAGPKTGLWFTYGYVAMNGTPHFVSPTPAPNTDSPDITAGPDGNVWFTTATSPPTITKMTPAGLQTSFTLPARCSPDALVTGSDGALWVDQTECGITRVTTSGATTLFPAPENSTVGSIAEGSDGAVWFNASGNHMIGRMDTSGNVTMYAAPPGSDPIGIVAAPDGNLWTLEHATHQHWLRITTSGIMTEFPSNLPEGGDGGEQLVVGRDGVVYANRTTSPTIARFDTSRLVALKPLTIPVEQSTYSMAIGPDNNLYAYIYNGGNPYVEVFFVHRVVVSTTSLNLTIGQMSAVSASESNVGPNTLSASSSNPSVATITPGSPGTYDVTGQSSGTCSVRIGDKSGNYVDVSVTVN